MTGVVIPLGDQPAYGAVVSAISGAVKSRAGQSEAMVGLVHRLIAETERYAAVAALHVLPFEQRRLMELRHGLTPEGVFSVDEVADRFEWSTDQVLEAEAAAAAVLGDWRPPVTSCGDPVSPMGDDDAEREARAYGYLARCARDRQRRHPLSGEAAERWGRVVGHLDTAAGNTDEDQS